MTPACQQLPQCSSRLAPQGWLREVNLDIPTKDKKQKRGPKGARGAGWLTGVSGAGLYHSGWFGVRR